MTTYCLFIPKTVYNMAPPSFLYFDLLRMNALSALTLA